MTVAAAAPAAPMPSSAASSGPASRDLEVLDHILWPYPSAVRVEQLIEAATERQLEESGRARQAAVPVPATAGPGRPAGSRPGRRPGHRPEALVLGGGQFLSAPAIVADSTLGPGDASPSLRRYSGQAHDQRQVAVHLGARRDERAAVSPAGHAGAAPGLRRSGERLAEGGSRLTDSRAASSRSVPTRSPGRSAWFPIRPRIRRRASSASPRSAAAAPVGGVGQLVASVLVASRSFRQRWALRADSRKPCARRGLRVHAIASSDSGISLPAVDDWRLTSDAV